MRRACIIEKSLDINSLWVKFGIILSSLGAFAAVFILGRDIISFGIIIFLFVPIIVTSWMFGWKGGLIGVTIYLIFTSILMREFIPVFLSPVYYGASISGAISFLFMAVAFGYVRDIMFRLRELKIEVPEYPAEQKRLNSLIPICMYCKKIRDENEEWHFLEVYIKKTFKVKFTHTICPDCFKKNHEHLESHE